jgi:hypothetical protein
MNGYMYNVDRNTGIKGHFVEVSDENENMLLDNGKMIFIIKWQKTWTNHSFVLVFCGS